MREALAAAVSRLEAAGVDTPRLDAELLLAHALGRDRTYLYAHLHDPLSPEREAAFHGLVRRRERREPLPYILGRWEFMGMPFIVTPAVLIPRSETETLVEAAAERLPEAARVLDVGAGSGCISAALAKRLPHARIAALEPSLPAAEIARRNLEALQVAGRVRVVVGSFPEDARDLCPLEGIVSNPPYIPRDEVERLAPELRCYEPREALDGGPDGLILLRSLVEVGADLLKPGGLLAVEVARGQADRVADLLRANSSWNSWNEPGVLPDLAGIPRVVVVYRR